MNADFDATLDNIVSNLDLKLLSVSGTTITINGAADSEQQVFQYVRQMTDTGRFEEITISSIRIPSDQQDLENPKVEYTLSLKVQADE